MSETDTKAPTPQSLVESMIAAAHAAGYRLTALESVRRSGDHTVTARLELAAGVPPEAP